MRTPLSVVKQLAASDRSKCVHFNGTMYARCAAGVNYRTLAGGPTLGWATRLPCWEHDSPPGTVSCDKLRYPTEEEALASATATVAAMDEHFAKLNNGECPRCGSESRRLVGRCAYCTVCGARLGQTAGSEP